MPFVSREGVRLYWRADGEADKPALLLLNSIGTDMGLWDRVVPHLSARFRLVRMDTRGHGASDAPAGQYSLADLAQDALSVLDAAGAPKAALCGVSLGGMVGLTLALVAPERVEALVVACTSAQMDPAAWQTRLDPVRGQGTAARHRSTVMAIGSPPPSRVRRWRTWTRRTCRASRRRPRSPASSRIS